MLLVCNAAIFPKLETDNEGVVTELVVVPPVMYKSSFKMTVDPAELIVPDTTNVATSTSPAVNNAVSIDAISWRFLLLKDI